jgi:hypothetical protein
MMFVAVWTDVVTVAEMERRTQKRKNEETWKKVKNKPSGNLLGWSKYAQLDALSLPRLMVFPL